MDAVSERFAQLQQNVGRRHAAATALKPGAPGHAEAFNELLAATDNLLAYTAHVPDLREEPARRTTALFVMWTARGSATLTAIAAASVIPGWVSWGWLILLLPLLSVALGSGWQAKPMPTGRPHRRHRLSAVLLAACVLLTSAVAIGALSAWFVLAVLVCGAAALLTSLPDNPPANRSTK